ncbi:MAG: extracellular solute-binding protein [Clostridiales bacterium]|nr:extracellular solute-binding protein [Clostridiales bacterium]
MKKKAVLLVAVIFVCAVLLSACNSGKNVTLTVWCAEMDREMITAMVDDFLATKPAIRDIVVEVCEDDTAREEFEGNPAAAADVICIPHDQLGTLVAQNFLLEIAEAKYHNAISQNTSPSIHAGQTNGKQYGFPSSFETHMLFYDKSIVSDTASQTLEGILSSHIPQGGYPFAMDFGNAYFSANWFFTYGCKLFGERGEDKTKCDFNNAGGVAAMTYLIDNRESFLNCDSDYAIELFKQHKLGAFIGGPWNAAAVTEVLKGNYGCARLPVVDGKAMKSFAGFKLYCVNAGTKNKGVALDLAAWLTNPDNQKTRFQTRNLIPVASSLADDADLAVSATAKAVMAQGPQAIAMPSIPEMSNFWSPVGDFTLACHSGEIQALDLQTKLDELAAAIKGSN